VPRTLTQIGFNSSGEWVSEATKEAKAELKNLIESFGSFGHHCDLLFVANGYDLSQIQALKNIRLNKAILDQHYKILQKQDHVLFMSCRGKHWQEYYMYICFFSRLPPTDSS
jgi:hypothetical protein